MEQQSEAGGRDMRRLHERGPACRGLAVDREGVALGGRCVLVRRTPAGYRCADLAEIRIVLDAAYGSDRNSLAVFAGICRIAEALEKQELAYAQIRGLYLPLPDLDADAARQTAIVSRLVRANFNPAEPRVPAGSPNGGEWTDNLSPGGLQAHLVEAGYTLAPEMWRVLRDLYRLFLSSGGDLAALRDYLADRGLQPGELPDAIRTLFDPPRPLAELQTTKLPMGFASEAELRAYLGPARAGYEWHHLIEQTGQYRPDLTSPAGIRTWIQHTDKHGSGAGHQALLHQRHHERRKTRRPLERFGQGTFATGAACYWGFPSARLRGHTMSGNPVDNWTDDRLVEQLRTAAIAQHDCGFDMQRGNRIDREKIVPYTAALQARGSKAVRKILPLLGDSNSNVRLIAAGCAFDLDPVACRRVLQELIQDGGVMQLFAWAVWSRHDPQTAPDPIAFVKPRK